MIADTKRPLAGKRIVVTRARSQAGALAERIEKLGGEVIEFPTIDIQPPESFAALDRAVAAIESYDWLFFTSVNSVDPFLSRLCGVGKSKHALAQLQIGAIGSETAKKLTTVGLKSCLVPERFQAEGMLEAIDAECMRGKRVLIPRAAEAREVLPETLRAWGASVDVVIAYRTAIPATAVAPLVNLFKQGRIDVITFTSSSTVRNFVRLFEGRRLDEICQGGAIACIGPITAQTVTDLGGHVTIVAREFTMAGLVQAIADYFEPE
ncbi:MAG TPA: uroporphyrinogen-III synthase [Terriglobales bacterium]|nr:uroporphyrinogen-III synthase [Terriglobales bacterium]